MTYNEIVEVNKTMKLTPIKGKDYAEVNQRVKAFRMLYPAGAIKTEIQSLDFDKGYVVIKATVCDDQGNIIGEGISYEKEGSSMINKTSFIENCETSAVGRALGFCGLGIDTSICSADELTTALEKQGEKKIVTEPIHWNAGNNKKDFETKCENCKCTIVPTETKNGDTMTVDQIVALSRKKYKKTLCAECMKREQTK